MAGRVADVHPAAQHGQCAAVSGQRAPMRAAVDAVRRARHDRPAGLGEAVAELGGHLLAVGAGRPCADHGHRPARHLVQACRATHPQRQGLAGIAIVGAVLGAAIAGRATRWDLVAISAAILIAVPTVMWASYRRRSLISGSGYLRLPSWWASGAPPVEGTAT